MTPVSEIECAEVLLAASRGPLTEKGRDILRRLMFERDMMMPVMLDLLEACKSFLEIDARHGYEFESNEPEVHGRIANAILKAADVRMALSPSI